ncbi:MAG: maleylacetoacetate isomerase [Burkholderiaceae bacterium]|nr:maleylacetoacetate isomerase [Burkholderiaceae bacterium]
MELYSFCNSSTSYRVRIALALKGLDVTYHGVNIRTGAQYETHYVNDINPQAGVPAVVEGDFSLGQSLAIIDWLDATHPDPRLIPLDSRRRARALEMSYQIGCDMHPVNNLRVLKYLQGTLKVTPEQKDAWYRHWVAEGLSAVEILLARASGEFGGPWCVGHAPTVADCCLVPQVTNALRNQCDLTPYPRVRAVYEHARAHPAFIQAEPQRQPDYIA